MINIAVDGPAGAGKSTISKIVAKKLNIIYLDTGAMYRGLACLAYDNDVEPSDENAVNELIKDVCMEIKYEDGLQQVIVNGKNQTPYIREHKVSKGASDISKHPSVRLKMVDLQREIASKIDVILDGRDIGTFVLPKAKYKFFLVATPEERAKRRYIELVEKGQKDVKLEDVLADINQRDKNDSSRALAPLKQADDAIKIDTTDMTIDEVVEVILSYIKWGS